MQRYNSLRSVFPVDSLRQQSVVIQPPPTTEINLTKRDRISN